ncbi:MAG TPA: sigma-54 dependent transcriptional regulator, partial [Terriglobales bacterium]
MSQILLIADDHELSSQLLSVLVSDGYDVGVSSAASAAYELCRGEHPAVVIVDLSCEKQDFELLERVFGLSPSSTVIALASAADSSKVVQAIRMGAVDYLPKPVEKQRLLSALLRHFPETIEEEDPRVLVEELDGDDFFLAASGCMKQIYEQVQRIGRVDVPVLITGESGTGKEIVAKLLHIHSPRAHKRFLKVNCAAIPDELLESELFGYEAGAFTGASKSKPGYFELCNRGTILLDEIGEMPPRLQAKLLQVLQEGKFFRLGGKWPVEVDVRVLAATNVDTKAAVEEGKLRLDLFYRLNTFGIHLPPLRERKEEIAPLFRQFVSRLSGKYQQSRKQLSEAAIAALAANDWPGNLRELHNAAKRYVLLGEQSCEPAAGHVGAVKTVKPHHEIGR